MDVSVVVENLNNAVAKLDGMYENLCQSVQIDSNYLTVKDMREKLTHIHLWIQSLADSIPRHMNEINSCLKKLNLL